MPFLSYSKSHRGILLVCLSIIIQWAQADISDDDFFSKYDEVIKQVACDAMAQREGSEMKININRYSTNEELAKIAFWNFGNDFRKTKLEFSEDIKWKRDFVDTIFEIFKSSCPKDMVPHDYLHVFRELIMIYLNSVDEENRGASNTEVWQAMQSMLTSCASEELEHYNVTAKRMEIHGIVTEINSVVETEPLFPPEEKVDVVFDDVDMVVDNLWWVFSHAMGRCYPKMPRAAIVAPKLRALFIRDVLQPLMNRWGDPGPNQNFGPIVGNFNINRVQRNIRHCVTAVYLLNGITELQMVRPLRVGYVQEGTNSVQNRKTGATVGK